MSVGVIGEHTTWGLTWFSLVGSVFIRQNRMELYWQSIHWLKNKTIQGQQFWLHTECKVSLGHPNEKLSQNNQVINVLDLESIRNTSNKHRNLKCHRTLHVLWQVNFLILTLYDSYRRCTVPRRVHERWLYCFHDFLCTYFYLRIKSNIQRVPSRLPNYSSYKFPSGP